MTPQAFPWIAVTSVLGFFVALLFMILKNWLNKLNENNKETLANNKLILTALQDLKLEYVRQNEQLKTLFNQNINFKSDLKSLRDEVEQIKLRQTSCGGCEYPKINHSPINHD